MRPVIGLAALATMAVVTPAHADPDWKAVAEAIGKPGSAAPGGVYRIGLPRSDLKVMLDGVAVKPSLALGSWLAFKAMGEKDAVVMGDLVLTEEEVNPVMKRLAEAGIDITAIHNHLLRARPATFYMHVHAHGDATKLALSLREALGASKTPLEGGSTAPPTTGATNDSVDLDTAAIAASLGQKGKESGGVYQVSVPRAETPRDGGMEVPEAMGSAIAINFQPTGEGKAAVTGDFVLTADEVNPVLRALRANGIEVTALHNHMLDDQPRLFFMHFWANDDANKLAGGLRKALDEMRVKRE